MNRTVVGAVLIVIIVILGALGVKFYLPYFEKNQQRATTDASKTKGKIVVALDNWTGYFVLRSPEMENAMRRAGYIFICEDDQADYGRRMDRLKAGEIDFAVATVDSYILNGANRNYPGAIVMVIDESKGGDAILARKEKVPGLDAIKGRNDIRVAFTPNSPSHHLAKAAADHFSVPELTPQGKLRIETNGSQVAMEKLLSGQADVAICWEPNVSRALANKNILKLLGTEDTERLIVDILVAGRKTLQKKPEVVQLVINTYFRVLKKYRENADLLTKEVKKETGLSKDAVVAMLKGVHWVNFNENCEKWFGISVPGQYADEGLVETIEASAQILKNAGDFSRTPIPDDDPYRLTNSRFLETLFAKGLTGSFTAGVDVTGGSAAINSLEIRFASLSEKQWSRLKQVGTLKVEPIIFQQGATALDLIAKKVVDQAVERLKHYPNFRIVIKGHTDIRGDGRQNALLSKDRADAVARYMKVVYNVDPNRLQVVGLGGAEPLAQLPGESRRAWMYRLPRVELVLVREEF
ncbi:MAG: phosphate ABC transporter substrate-binding/OmpA family protein [Desulfobacteraceae bacterium]|jgi:outer membrane protein OmpA-like peptidoglycan-associated protein/ABC-type taurine transport system substrate-binding protein